MNDPQLKSYVVQVATSLAMQIRSARALAEIGFVGDLCRHLRKSLQASSEFVGEQELNLNISLQNSIENCLLEIANGVGLGNKTMIFSFIQSLLLNYCFFFVG